MTQVNQVIVLTLHSPANLFVVDPQGRRAGVDPSTGQTVLEIPGAIFSGAGTEPETLTLPPAGSGNYTIQVVGTAAGSYHLDIAAAGMDSGLLSTQVSGTTTSGQADTFTLNYNSPNGSMSTVTGNGDLPPVAIDDSVFTNINAAASFDVLANDSDPDGSLNRTSMTLVSNPANGTAAVDPKTGIINYTPANGFSGIDLFTYTVQDNLGTVSNVANVFVNIGGDGQPPQVAMDDSATTRTNTPVTIYVLSNDSEHFGDLIPSTVTVALGPSHGTTVVDASGVITYTPDASFTGTDSFTYTVLYDEGTQSNPATVSVNVSSIVQLAISNLSSTSVTAGGTVSFTVTAQDSGGQPVPSYTGTVLITSTDSSAMFNSSPLPGSYTFVAGDNGSHTFTITLVSAGSQTITVTDQTSSSLTAATSPITVAAAPFSQYMVSVLGGNTIGAGNSFLFTVQAADQFNNPVTSYSGPASVTTTITPTDPQSNFPITGTFNSSGFGFFLGDLKTAGSYTLTATAGTFTGASGSLTVTPASVSYFTVAAPATATTGTPFNVAVEAFDFFGNVASAYTGHAHFTSTDGSATLPIDSTLTSGMGTFNVTLNSAGSQTIKATDTLSTNPTITGTSSAITTRGLVVNTFTPTFDGFKVAFSKPFIPGDVTLYGSSLTTPQDVTLVGANTGPVVGSLILDSDNKGFTFKASSAPLLAFHGAAVLPDDTYTVTIISGTATNGFLDALGANLDGASNAGHANYTTTFTVANGSKPILSIPDFARGPDETHAIKVPNDTSRGIPITLYNAVGVTDVTLTLSYNPSLLTITGGLGGPQSDATDTGSSFTMLLTPGVFGQVTFQFHDAIAQSGTVILGDIVAMVPNSAASNYKAKELFQFISIAVNGVAFTGALANGVHVNAYLGDVTGNGTIDGLDVATANTVARGTATGFNAFSLLDPAIVGDPASDISVDAGDVSDLAAYTVHLPTPVIPAIPTGLTITPVGADPTLSLGSGLQGTSGMVSVPVLLDHPHPEGSTGMTEAILALTYDPSVLSVSTSDITLGSIPSMGTGWQLTSVVDQTTGQIGIEMFSMTPITAAQAGSLVNIAFHVRPGVSVPATAVQLVNSVMPSGRQFMTQVDDAQGQFVLSPGMGRVVVQTSGASVTAAPPVNTGPSTAISKKDFAQSILQDAAGTASLLAGAETSDAAPFAFLINDFVPGPTALALTGVFAFQPNLATQLVGQMLQIGSLPLLNTLLYQNSPGQLALDELFLALARRMDLPENDLDRLIWAWRRDSKQADLPGTLNEQQAAGQPSISDQSVVVDKVFDRLADDIDGFIDFGD